MKPYDGKKARRLTALEQRQKPDNLDGYFIAITQQFRPYIQALAFSILGNRDDAEDMVSEALCKAYIHLHGFTLEERENLKAKAWLGEITRNLCLNLKKKAKGESLERLLEGGLQVASHPYSNPENRAIYADGVAIISKCLNDGLSAREREIVQRYLLAGESGETVARSLGMSRTTLYVTFHRAIRKLRHPQYGRQLLARVGPEVVGFILGDW